MSNVLITPNMTLPNPIPTQELGPQWAYDISACLTIVDSHNHSAGQGVQIQPNGMNINSDLPFNSNNATLLRTTRFVPQASPIANAGLDIGELYVSGNELYYNDVTGGNQVQLTNSGSVNAGAGSITGLPSGTASATFSSSTFVWQSATNTAANMDFRSAIFRNAGASSYGLTLSAPTLAANSALVLPAIPGSQSFLTLDTSGNISGYASINQGISRNNLVAVGQQISSSSGTFSTNNGSFTAVTNLSVTITTSGRPVMILLQADGSGNVSGIQMSSAGTTTNASMNIGVFRGVTLLSNSKYEAQFASVTGPFYSIPPSSIAYLDTPTSGTYTYTVQVYTNVLCSVDYCVLAAYEL